MLTSRTVEVPLSGLAEKMRVRSARFAAAIATTAAAVACWTMVNQYRVESRALTATDIAASQAKAPAAGAGAGTGEGSGSRTSSEADQKLSQRYKLSCRSAMIPHPEKVAKGGEDALFVEEEIGVVGVFDGVGGWASKGIDPGAYSKTLARTMARNVRQRRDPRLTVQCLVDAAEETNLPGSSTAIVVGLVDDSESTNTARLVGVNVGDSAAMVVRDRKLVYRSEDLLHGFNFPFQLGWQSKDKVFDGDPIAIPKIYEDDIILLGSDGLFDNVFDSEILEVLERYDTLSGYEERNTVRVNPEKRMQGAADEIADMAFEYSLSRHRQSPFQVSAQKAGYQYQGGKSDDITVVVCSICAKGDDEEEDDEHSS